VRRRRRRQNDRHRRRRVFVVRTRFLWPVHVSIVERRQPAFALRSYAFVEAGGALRRGDLSCGGREGNRLLFVRPREQPSAVSGGDRQQIPFAAVVRFAPINNASLNIEVARLSDTGPPAAVGGELWQRLRARGCRGSLVVGEWATRRWRTEEVDVENLHRVLSARTIVRLMTVGWHTLAKRSHRRDGSSAL
jgi:hypothetical protein